MKNDFPILISILVTLLIICGLVVATGDASNKNVVLALLALCAFIANLQLRNFFAVRKDIEAITNNAKLLRKGQSIPTQKFSASFADLDESIRQIRVDFNELSRREQSLIAQALDVICSIGPDQVFRSVNPASKKVLGYEPEELIGMKFTDIVLEEDRESSLNSSLGAARSVDVMNFENRVRRKD
ncbi:MAG: PAS domain S-box protein, partial [Candidatus Obscuribacterales bacterium]|nr:PAS domain S-box protein [Candidatus Obscuribacterales bacterium]